MSGTIMALWVLNDIDMMLCCFQKEHCPWKKHFCTSVIGCLCITCDFLSGNVHRYSSCYTSLSFQGIFKTFLELSDDLSSMQQYSIAYSTISHCVFPVLSAAEIVWSRKWMLPLWFWNTDTSVSGFLNNDCMQRERAEPLSIRSLLFRISNLLQIFGLWHWDVENSSVCSS